MAHLIKGRNATKHQDAIHNGYQHAFLTCQGTVGELSSMERSTYWVPYVKRHVNISFADLTWKYIPCNECALVQKKMMHVTVQCTASAKMAQQNKELHHFMVCNFSSMMAISLLSSRQPIAPTCSRT